MTGKFMYQVTWFASVGAALVFIAIINNTIGGGSHDVMSRSILVNGAIMLLSAFAFVAFSEVRQHTTNVSVSVAALQHRTTSLLIILAALLTLDASLWVLSIGLGLPLLLLLGSELQRTRITHDHYDGSAWALVPTAIVLGLSPFIMGIEYGHYGEASFTKMVVLMGIAHPCAYALAWGFCNDARRRFERQCEQRQQTTVSPTMSRDYRPGNNVDIRA